MRGLGETDPDFERGQAYRRRDGSGERAAPGPWCTAHDDAHERRNASLERPLRGLSDVRHRRGVERFSSRDRRCMIDERAVEFGAAEQPGHDVRVAPHAAGVALDQPPAQQPRLGRPRTGTPVTEDAGGEVLAGACALSVVMQVCAQPRERWVDRAGEGELQQVGVGVFEPEESGELREPPRRRRCERGIGGDRPRDAVRGCFGCAPTSSARGSSDPASAASASACVTASGPAGTPSAAHSSRSQDVRSAACARTRSSTRSSSLGAAATSAGGRSVAEGLMGGSPSAAPTRRRAR